MFLVEIGHTAGRALLHRCYTLASALQLFHGDELPIQPGVQRLDALAKAKIAQALHRADQCRRDRQSGSRAEPGLARGC